LLLNTGEPVRAIRLADMVNHADADNVEATQVLITAHEKLLQDSSNFWEAAWLRKRIEELS
jgi:hypothetical protein